jgi:hypothetical protein
VGEATATERTWDTADEAKGFARATASRALEPPGARTGAGEGAGPRQAGGAHTSFRSRIAATRSISAEGRERNPSQSRQSSAIVSPPGAQHRALLAGDDVTGFHAESSGLSRYLWSPEVHVAFGERCYFYVIAGNDPQRRSTFTEQLELLLDSIDIESRTVHVLIGEYDALLRVWATESARQRFLRSLRSSDLHIDTFIEFASDEIWYTFGPERRTLGPEFALSADDKINIRRVALAEHERSWPEDACDARDALAKPSRPLIFEVPPVSGVKVFMFLAENGTALSQPRDLVIGVLAAEAAKAEMSQVSVYSGVGFCAYVIKGWVKSFDDALPAINRIRREAKDLRLSPWSLYAADSNVRTVGETIDAIQAELPGVLEEFLDDTVGLPEGSDSLLRRELASLPADDRDALIRIYRHAREDLRPDELPRLVEVIAYSVLRDRKSFNRSMSYLTSIEEDLRSLVPRLLAESMGNNWLKDADTRGWLANDRGALDESDGLDGDMKKVSLASLLLVLGRASEEWPAIADEIRDFPPGWRSRTREVLKLRNQFAHGSLWDLARSRTFDGDWGERFETIVLSIRIQTTLELKIETLDRR